MVPYYADFECLLFEAGHPILQYVTARLTMGVHERADRFVAHAANHSTPRPCTGAHSCITTITGPYAYRAALAGAFGTCTESRRSQLSRRGGRVDSFNIPCVDNGDAMRATHRCQGEWLCGRAEHLDCRNSRAKRQCGKQHYTYKSEHTTFFNLSVGHNYPRLGGRASLFSS